MSEVWIVPILHPSYIIRGNWKHDPAQSHILAMAAQLAYGDYEPPNIEDAPPDSNLDPTVEELYAWVDGMEQGVTCDIEAAGPHLVCIGFCKLDDLSTVVVRFRKKGAVMWDADWDVRRAKVEWVYGVLASPDIPKVFHNGQAYDIPMLTTMGFDVSNYAGDTMLMAHVAYPEMPKGLEYLGVLYARVPGWKHLTRDYQGEGK